MKQIGIGYGYGKTILFGEHFVVYGLPGIVTALDNQLITNVAKSNYSKHILIDKTNKFKTADPQTYTFETNQSGAMLSAIIDHIGINDYLDITLYGTIKIANSGMGASAASCVALALAIDDLYDLNLSDAQINKAAYAGEMIMHGKPSGIDNTAATYGGTFVFERNHITPIKLKTPLYIVLAESGIKTKTKEVVEDVRKLKEKDHEFVQNLFTKYRDLASQAYEALKNNNLDSIGKLMNKNHELLVKLTVSHPELNRMVELSLDAGAVGAKMTGTGRGGLMLALAANKKNQHNIADKLEAYGYETLLTTIGGQQSTLW